MTMVYIYLSAAFGCCMAHNKICFAWVINKCNAIFWQISLVCIDNSAYAKICLLRKRIYLHYNMTW